MSPSNPLTTSVVSISPPPDVALPRRSFSSRAANFFFRASCSPESASYSSPRHHPHQPEEFLVGLREIRGGLCPHLCVRRGWFGLFVKAVELLEKAQLLLETLESIPDKAVHVFGLLLSLGGIEQKVSPEFEKFPVHRQSSLYFRELECRNCARAQAGNYFSTSQVKQLGWPSRSSW